MDRDDERKIAAIRNALLNQAKQMDKVADAAERAANAHESAAKALLKSVETNRQQVFHYRETAQLARQEAAKLQKGGVV